MVLREIWLTFLIIFISVARCCRVRAERIAQDASLPVFAPDQLCASFRDASQHRLVVKTCTELKNIHHFKPHRSGAVLHLPRLFDSSLEADAMGDELLLHLGQCQRNVQ